jgi:hypothetical protein
LLRTFPRIGELDSSFPTSGVKGNSVSLSIIDDIDVLVGCGAGRSFGLVFAKFDVLLLRFLDDKLGARESSTLLEGGSEDIMLWSLKI